MPASSASGQPWMPLFRQLLTKKRSAPWWCRVRGRACLAGQSRGDVRRRAFPAPERSCCADGPRPLRTASGKSSSDGVAACPEMRCPILLLRLVVLLACVRRGGQRWCRRLRLCLRRCSAQRCLKLVHRHLHRSRHGGVQCSQRCEGDHRVAASEVVGNLLRHLSCAHRVARGAVRRRRRARFCGTGERHQCHRHIRRRRTSRRSGDAATASLVTPAQVDRALRCDGERGPGQEHGSVWYQEPCSRRGTTTADRCWPGPN